MGIAIKMSIYLAKTIGTLSVARYSDRKYPIAKVVTEYLLDLYMFTKLI
jgi:hypothetical protein